MINSVQDGRLSEFYSEDINLISCSNDNFGSRESYDYKNIIEPKYTEPKEDESWFGSILGKIWSIPNTIIGLGWGLLGTLFGAEISFGNNAIQFENHPFMFKGGAITLGNIIAYGEGSGPDIHGDHERQHTYQGQVMGPLYLFAHLFEGTQALINDGHWHGPSNDLESGPLNRCHPHPW